MTRFVKACLCAAACAVMPVWGQQDLTLSGAAPAGTHSYQAINSITAANYTIHNGSHIRFEAGNVVRLQSGFRAFPGSAFEAAITPLVVAPALASPAAGGSGNAGTAQVFTVTYADARGYGDIVSINLSFGGTDPGQGICSMVYPYQGTVALWDNTGTTLLTQPQNSQCAVGAWQVTGVGTNTLTLTVPITFPASFAGARGIYAAGVSASSSFAPWSELGTWNVATAAPYFNFEIYPTARQSIGVGGVRAYDATITPFHGFQGTVSLGAQLVWPTPSVIASMPPAWVTVTGSGQARFQVFLQGTTNGAEGNAIYWASAGGVTQYAAANFLVQAGAPPPPGPVTLTGPANGASVPTAPALSWTRRAGPPGTTFLWVRRGW